MKIKDIKNAIWSEAWVKIGNDNCEFDTVWEGYACEIPEEYMEIDFDCLVPMDDYGPVIGIQLF